jgi:hypothetical protein
MLESRVNFHCHVEYFHYQTPELLGIIVSSYNYSPLGNLKVVYITLIRSELAYAPVVWKCLALGNSKLIYAIIDSFSPSCLLQL